MTLPSQPPNDTYENHDDMVSVAMMAKTNEEANNNCETMASVAILSQPPAVNRNLKPEVRPVHCNSTLPSGLYGPPVERNRKPKGFDTHGKISCRGTPSHLGNIPPGMVIPGKCNWERETWEEESNSEGGSRRNSSDEQIYFYMPSLQQSTGGKWDPLMIPAHDMRDQAVQYLDLDLPVTDTSLGEVERVQSR